VDPNTILNELLEICTENIALGEDLDVDTFDAGELTSICDRFLRMTDLLSNLHEWIRKGGFLPEVWQREQDKLSSEYFRATLTERFPFLLGVAADGTHTPDYEEPSCVDVVDALESLWSECLSDTTIRPELVPLCLDERRFLNAILTRVREGLGEGWTETIGYGEDDLYSVSFDIMSKLDGQPQPPPSDPTPSLHAPPPRTFRTDDGYTLQWDPVNREWFNSDMTFPAAGWSWWPVDHRGEPLPGGLL
jgi:hypothetical protein